MKRIRTRYQVPFPPAQVWSVLTDFRSYSQWNPLNVSAEGDARPGARVAMRFVDAGGGQGKVIAQIVTLTDCVPERRLEWVGRIPLLFTGRHFFELSQSGGATDLVHGEDLSGLVPMTFSKRRIERQKAAYEAMNVALADRVAELADRVPELNH